MIIAPETATDEEIAAVRSLIAKQPDSELLSQILGLEEAPERIVICEIHNKPMKRRHDCTGWRCRACEQAGSDAKRARFHSQSTRGGAK